MELRVEDIKLPEVINFNFEELKADIQAKANEYNGLVYTDAQIAEAKKDVANFRKLKEAIENERKRVKKECEKPYKAFEAKIKEIVAVLDEPINSIALQITQYDDKKKHEKREEIEEYWLELMDSGKVPQGINLLGIFDEKWLNSSVKMNTVMQEIDARVEQINNDLNTISFLPNFSFEAREVYLSTLDINKAISEGKRMADMQAKKAEEQAKKIEESVTDTSQEIHHIEFWAEMTVGQAQALREYLKINGIRFGQIGA